MLVSRPTTMDWAFLLVVFVGCLDPHTIFAFRLRRTPVLHCIKHPCEDTASICPFQRCLARGVEEVLICQQCPKFLWEIDLEQPHQRMNSVSDDSQGLDSPLNL